MAFVFHGEGGREERVRTEWSGVEWRFRLFVFSPFFLEKKFFLGGYICMCVYGGDGDGGWGLGLFFLEGGGGGGVVVMIS